MKRRIIKDEHNQQLDFLHLMNMYGLQYDGHTDSYTSRFNQSDGNISIKVKEINDNDYDVTILTQTSPIMVSTKHEQFASIFDLINYLDVVMLSYDLTTIHATTICYSNQRKAVILAAISAKDLSKNLVRVKSSNVWAYTINVKDRKQKSGDVVCQFKNKNGGPGDVYMYYDVPLNVWRRWLAAPSKGHFFWANIRNNYYYRKLTGNKRGVLKNAIN